MPAGEALTREDLKRLEKAVHNAEAFSGLIFSVFVGVAEENARAYAERLHGALEDPARSVLVLCDPEFHALEIVTGTEARRWLSDEQCGLAAATMQTSFVVGDIVGGLATGIQQLGEAARHPRTLHTTRPDL
ncbi:MAG TPA: DUF5130 family protein [Propionibacteriaceae bacterium]|nr:DUF5130 family protein [Propionibacteriaceae bacterium]